MTLSPKLFYTILEHLFRNFKRDNYGIKVNQELLTNLTFAKHVVLFVESQEQLTSNLDKESRKIRPTTNF